MARDGGSFYWRGFREALPFVLAVCPFGLLFGAVASGAGLPISQVMGFSFLVVAGAAQFAALQLMQAHAPTVIVLAVALAVNLRMAMYSASLVPHLGKAPLWQRAIMSYFMVDQAFAVSQARFERAPAMTPREKAAFYFGTVTPLVPSWYAGTVIGATLGAAIPSGLAIDFILPLAFLALVAPMLRSLAHLAAAVTSIVVALLCAGLPYQLGLMVAAPCAMVAGAAVERWQERKKLEWT